MDPRYDGEALDEPRAQARNPNTAIPTDEDVNQLANQFSRLSLNGANVMNIVRNVRPTFWRSGWQLYKSSKAKKCTGGSTQTAYLPANAVANVESYSR